MKVAIVHYWLVGMRGGEKVIEEFCKLYPEADIFTHVAIPENLSELLLRHKIIETSIARLPGSRKHYQKYLPFMPKALEELDLTDYDLVISSESGPAKGVITRPDALHICYCHSPMRYIWDQYHTYRAQAGWITRALMPWIAHRLRIWDTASATRVDHIIANSDFVARRVAKYWGRTAEVVHPPVDLEAFASANSDELGDFYLYVGELVSYKRADLMVEAFNESGRTLVVIGDGADRDRLIALAKPNVTFLGRTSADVLKDYYARCKALIFPGVEDFGIVPLEAMASGRPVIALGKGGARETVKPGVTGVWFDEPTVAALNAAVETCERDLLPNLDADAIANFVAGFRQERFREEIATIVARELEAAESANGA